MTERSPMTNPTVEEKSSHPEKSNGFKKFGKALRAEDDPGKRPITEEPGDSGAERSASQSEKAESTSTRAEPD